MSQQLDDESRTPTTAFPSVTETLSAPSETALAAQLPREDAAPTDTTTPTIENAPAAAESAAVAETVQPDTATRPNAPEDSTLGSVIESAQEPVAEETPAALPTQPDVAATPAETGEPETAMQPDAAPPQANGATNPPAATAVPPKSIMQQLLDEPGAPSPLLKRGEVREGVVVFKSAGEILVDVNAKSEGSVPAKEFQQLSAEDFAKMKVGDTVLVYVVQSENQDGVPVLSIDKTLIEKAWRRLQVQYEAGETIEATVSDFNKGGVLVELGGVRGFVPSSQISRLVGASEASRQTEMQRLINTRLPLKIIEIDRPRNRLILSERQAAQEQRDIARDRIMVELEEGQERDGIIASIAEFGAFVDIGGIDGLVHLSELSWSRVTRPQDVVRVGEKVRVRVLNVDRNSRKVALSIKQAQPEPWSRILAQYQQGQIVQGTITQIANFGAFARIADGVEGLIHVSELAEGRVAHPRDVVKDGDVVNVKIIRIDAERRRMGLSVKQAMTDGYAGIVGGPTFVEGQTRQIEGTPELPAPTADDVLPEVAPMDTAPAQTAPSESTDPTVEAAPPDAETTDMGATQDS